MIYKYTIPLPPVTKKNSQRILVNRKTGMPFIAPSSAYKRYEAQAIYFLAPKPKTPLAGRYRVTAVFYMPTRRRLNRQMLWSLLPHGVRAGATATNMANNIRECLLQTELKTVQKHFPALRMLWPNNGEITSGTENKK